jgi:hypothetical protein
MDFSILPFEDLPPEFDYETFLQETKAEDVDCLAEESSTSTSSTVAAGNPSLHDTVSPAPTTLKQSVSPTPRQRLERRGHTKSRRGCFNCKRRRIKVLRVLLHASVKRSN